MMSRPAPKRIRPVTAILLTSLCAFGALGVAAATVPPALLINETPSLPRGLYLRQARPLQRDAIVAFAAPAVSQSYLETLSVPTEMRLLKRVAAVAGDRVCRTGDRLEVSDRDLPVRTHDRRGVRLPVWTGCRRLGSGEIVVLGDTPDSFDSRYFGPLKTADLDGVYREVITW